MTSSAYSHYSPTRSKQSALDIRRSDMTGNYGMGSGARLDATINDLTRKGQPIAALGGGALAALLGAGVGAGVGGLTAGKGKRLRNALIGAGIGGLGGGVGGGILGYMGSPLLELGPEHNFLNTDKKTLGNLWTGEMDSRRANLAALLGTLPGYLTGKYDKRGPLQ